MTIVASAQPSATGSISRWLLMACATNVAWQIIRLQQTSTTSWLLCDYAMRLSTLALLAANPAVRKAIFGPERLRVSLAIAINWGLLLIPITWLAWIIGDAYAAFLPEFRLGFYPAPAGWLRSFDLTFGIALVAIHEELVFRRAMRMALAELGDGRAMTLVSALLFGAYHWWTGVPNMIYATIFGIVAMVIYRRVGALWPVMVIHYLADFSALY